MLLKKENGVIEAEPGQNNIFVAELSNHIRFTLLAVITAAVILILARKYLFSSYSGSTLLSENLFDGFFISHLFFASLTPAALFSIYRRSFLLSIFLAIATSAITCTLSDIIFPYVGGLVLSYEMSFHVCIVEEPILAWTFIITGALIGYFLSQYIRKLSRYTHSAHILISSLAAGLYLVSYGVSFLSLKALLFIPILFVSVLVPCVLNDIGVPSYIVTLTAKSDSNKKKLLHDLHAEHHGHEH
jgi:hypothetical protein